MATYTVTITHVPPIPSPDRLLAIAEDFADEVIDHGLAAEEDQPSDGAMAAAAEVVARFLGEDGTSADCLVNLIAETIDRHRSEAQP